MENTFWTAFGTSALAALVTSAGIYVIRYFNRWGRENNIYFICFAAGVLISVSFLHIIPKAFSMNGNGPFYLFAGYLSLHFPINEPLLGALLPFPPVRWSMWGLLTSCLRLKQRIKNIVSWRSVPEFWWPSLSSFQRHREVLGSAEVK